MKSTLRWKAELKFFSLHFPKDFFCKNIILLDQKCPTYCLPKLFQKFFRANQHKRIFLPDMILFAKNLLQHYTDIWSLLFGISDLNYKMSRWGLFTLPKTSLSKSIKKISGWSFGWNYLPMMLSTYGVKNTMACRGLWKC